MTKTLKTISVSSLALSISLAASIGPAFAGDHHRNQYHSHHNQSRTHHHQSHPHDHQHHNHHNHHNQSCQKGRWVTGDLHIHTAVSADARSPLSDVLSHSFNDFDLDYVSISNHMRDNSQDNDDNNVGGLLYYDALVQYELPGIAQLQEENYKDKLIISSFEWDMPTHEHYNVGILWNDKNKDERLEAIKEFEYRFSNKNNLSDFNQDDVAAWTAAGIVRQNQTHEDGVAALAWLQQKFSDSSYGLLVHPRRYASSYTIANVRELNDTAPDVFFLIEGMVGSQLQAERGDYGSSSYDGVHGGADPVLSEVGGWWDALLGEGRKIWVVGNSDHHFKTRTPYASAYYPGEYAKNYTFVSSSKDDELTGAKLLDGLRSGNTFLVTGDLINALDFTARTNGKNPGTASKTMGETLVATRGDLVTIKVSFMQPEKTNREAVVNNGVYDGVNPGVRRIDLIVGNVGSKAEKGTDAYDVEKNESTHIAKSFTEDDWRKMKDGYYSMEYTFRAEKNQYFRLRGTNLEYNVEGVIVNGEPQRSAVISTALQAEPLKYFEASNERNYNDVWFYSNPIFVDVKERSKGHGKWHHGHKRW